MWVDVHAHLSHLPPGEFSSVVASALAAGVERIVNTGFDLESSRTVVAQCATQPCCLATVGVSPFDGSTLPEGWQEQLRRLAESPGVVAIGEAGIDQSNPRYPCLAEQLPPFEAQAAMAVDLGLPLIVHSRGAERRAAEVCRGLGVRKALFHCFTGDADALRVVLDCGYWVSFSGIVTFARPSLAPQVRSVPLDRLCIETDTPYLAPVPHRGKPNQPAWAGLVGAAVAAMRGEAPEALATALSANFAALFGRQPPWNKPAVR